MKVSDRGAVPPFLVLDILRQANERIAAGKDVLHLEAGQPSTGAPRAVVEAACTDLGENILGYTEAIGTPALRARIAQHYNESYGVDIPASRIGVVAGSSAGFILTFLSAFEAGNRIAMACPGYPAYRNIMLCLGIEPVEIPTGPETNYALTPEMLDQIEGPLHGVMVASPANPTGGMLTPDELKALCKWCDAHDVLLLSDEVYHGITYGAKQSTAAAFSDRALVINSFSKYFSMTGWRLGWLVLPEELARPVECLAQSLFISPTTLSQHAAMQAFDCNEELDLNVARYRRNRDLLLDGLPRIGLDKISRADGGFYLYVDISDLTDDSCTFCRDLLDRFGVATTPGVDFDPQRGNRTMRLSYAGSTEGIEAAIERMGLFVHTLKELT